MVESPDFGPWRLFAPAKVNLGLEVLGKREDGLHEVVTVMETISLFDVIDIAPAKALQIHCDADIPEDANLVGRAIDALTERASVNLPLRIHLTKRIPTSAGVGGGSSDAGTVLSALQHLYELDDALVCEIAASLGSDVPFFLEGGIALATGRGTDIEMISSNTRRWYALVTPEVEIPAKTATLYGSLDASDFSSGHDTRAIAESLRRDSRVDFALLRNAFTRPLMQYEPISDAVQALADAGAEVILPSGAGPTVFAPFRRYWDAQRVAMRLKPHFRQVSVATSVRRGLNDFRLG